MFSLQRMAGFKHSRNNLATMQAVINHLDKLVQPSYIHLIYINYTIEFELNWLSRYKRKGCTEEQAYVGAPPVTTTQSTVYTTKIDTGIF